MNKNFNFSSIIKEEIEKILQENKKNLIVEFAIPRKIYKKRIDNIIPQILENWTLVHYCTLTNNDVNRCKNHWKSELRGFLFSASRLAINGNDSINTRKKVINEIFNENDYNSPTFLNLTIVNKFISENIDTSSKIYGQVIENCINSLNDIFSVILGRNVDEIKNYVENI